MRTEIKRTIHKFSFGGKYFHSRSFVFSSCASWVILIASGVWLIQTSLLRAMDGKDPESCPLQKNLTHSTKFYEKDAEHPLTRPFWRERDISTRLENIRHELEDKKKELRKNQKDYIEISDEDLEKYKKIFSLEYNAANTKRTQSLQDTPYDELLLPSDSSKVITNGRSGNEVIIWSRENHKLIVIKKFKPENIKDGLQELLHSLVVVNINPSPQELKIVRIYDAFLCSKNYLNIIIEPANGKDIHSFLSNPLSTKVVTAYAKYLAKFHIKNHHKLDETLDGQKYKNHVKRRFDSVMKSFSLFNEIEQINSNNVLKLLVPNDQEKFKTLIKRTCDKFTENSGKVLNYLGKFLGNTRQEVPYFLTLTHGDAHGNNFFYENDENLTHQGNKISMDSHYRITMIDFTHMIKTYGSIGDPAEDVGRFLGSLWDWVVQENNNILDNNKILDDGERLRNNKNINNLRNQFIKTYLKIIKESNVIAGDKIENFKKIFRENYKFYELRFYRTLFNAEKGHNLEKDKNIKLEILKSWITENSNLEDYSEGSNQQTINRKKSKNCLWIPDHDDQQQITSWPPDQSVKFIESSTTERLPSCLAPLYEELHRTGTTTRSSNAIIVGMGGDVKTSFPLEYAYGSLNPVESRADGDTIPTMDNSNPSLQLQSHASESISFTLEHQKDYYSSNFYGQSIPETSTASRAAPPFGSLLNYARSLFSCDSLLKRAVQYSQTLVNECPSYYSKIDSRIPVFEGANKNFYNYPAPHLKALEHEQSLYLQAINYSQVIDVCQPLHMPLSLGFQSSVSPQ